MKYALLAALYDKLTSTPKRLEKTSILSGFLRQISSGDMEMVMLLLKGRVFPAWDQREIGIADKLVIRAIKLATGIDEAEIASVWKRTGDLGQTAQELTGRKRQSTLFSRELAVTKVFSNLQKLAGMEGAGVVNAKVQIVAELLTSAGPVEAKYIVRTVLQDLRVGLGEGTIRDSITWAFFSEEAGIKYDCEKNNVEYEKGKEEYEKYAAAVQNAINLTNDFAAVASKAKEGGIGALTKISLRPETPIKVMLYLKAKDIGDAFKIVGKPAAIECKYDGFRVQLHRKNGKITIFTRRLEDVTAQFPDVVKYVQEHVKGDSFIIEGEAVGYDPTTKKYVAFQKVSQRIKRKYDIEQVAAKFPVEVNVFDVISYEGKNFISLPFAERRKQLESMIQNPEQYKIVLAKQLVTSDEGEARKFYDESLAAGNEGIMMKNLEGEYNPGARVGLGVKVKPVMDSLEVVVVGAEWGEGKRGEWLSSFIIGVRNPETGEIAEIGRVGTGFKEKEEEGVSFGQMTELLKPLIVSEEGRVVKVKPKIIIEVEYEEIQSSPTYNSGYALRFPRFVKLREDRGIDDINTTEDVQMLYSGQRGRNA